MEERELSEIFISRETKEHTLKYKGRDFTFKVRELPWVTLNKIASKCLDYSGKKVSLDKSEYDVQFLEAALVEAPWPLKETRMVLSQINKDFGNLLRNEIIPNPFSEDNEELKNE